MRNCSRALCRQWPYRPAERVVRSSGPAHRGRSITGDGCWPPPGPPIGAAGDGRWSQHLVCTGTRTASRHKVARGTGSEAPVPGRKQHRHAFGEA